MEDIKLIYDDCLKTKKMEKECKIRIVEPIGCLVHKPTKTQITVYTRIGWFKRTMLKYFFGLEYIETKNK